MAFKRKSDAGHVGQNGAVPCGNNTYFFAFDRSARGLDTDHLITFALNTNNLAVLQDIYTQSVCRTGEPPGNGVVTGNTRARLERRTHDRVAQRCRRVHDRHHFLDLCRIQNHAINTIEPVGVHAAIDVPHVLQGMPHIHYTSLAEHGVVVQVLRQALPQLQRFFVEVSSVVPQVVGPHDGGVARRIAATQPASFNHGDIAHAMLFGQVIGCCQTMPTSTNDDGIVTALRRGTAPLLLPVLVIRHGIAGKRKN